MNNSKMRRGILIMGILTAVIATADDTGSLNVLSQSDGYDCEIYFYTDGVYETVTDNATDDHSPAIAYAPTGEPHISWVGFRGHDADIFYADRRNGKWAVPERLTENSVSDTNPSILVDVDGTIWVVWAHFDGEDDEIFYMYKKGNSWSIPQQVNINDRMPDILPSLKINSHGRVEVAWEGYDGERYAEYSSYWNDERWTDEQKEEVNARKYYSYSMIIEDKYVGFGDSITWGSGSSEGGGYGPFLEEKLVLSNPAATVILRGEGGEKTSGGVERIDTVLAEENGEYFLILEGTNDVQAGISHETIMYNLEEMVRKTEEYGSIPVLGTLPPRRDLDWWNVVTEDLNEERIRSYALEEGILLADHMKLFYAEPDWEALVGRKSEHPNDEGYQVMAESWYIAIEEDFPPSGLTATLDGEIVTLKWDESVEEGHEGYNVYRRLPPGTDYEKLNEELLSETTYTDSNLSSPGYSFAVTSVDLCGNESDYSQEVTITPGSESDSGCFIATATYGVSSSQVEKFRALRDDHLLKTSAGEGMVHFYYTFSPGVSSVISKSVCLRAFARKILFPVYLFTDSYVKASDWLKLWHLLTLYLFLAAFHILFAFVFLRR